MENLWDNENILSKIVQPVYFIRAIPLKSGEGRVGGYNLEKVGKKNLPPHFLME